MINRVTGLVISDPPEAAEFEEAQKAGKRAPLHVWVPAELDARLRDEAVREQRTVTATVERALRYYLNRERGEAA